VTWCLLLALGTLLAGLVVGAAGGVLWVARKMTRGGR